jgi:hypothetical protein
VLRNLKFTSASCPILSAVLSRKGWEATNPNQRLSDHWPLRHHLQPNPLMLLKAGNDFEEVGSSRIAFRAEHLMQRLGVDAGLLGQRGKAHHRVDKVAEDLAAQRPLARKQSINGVAQQAPPKNGCYGNRVRVNRKDDTPVLPGHRLLCVCGLNSTCLVLYIQKRQSMLRPVEPRPQRHPQWLGYHTHHVRGFGMTPMEQTRCHCEALLGGLGIGDGPPKPSSAIRRVSQSNTICEKNGLPSSLRPKPWHRKRQRERRKLQEREVS